MCNAWMRELWIEIYGLLAWCVGLDIFVVLFNSVKMQKSQLSKFLLQLRLCDYARTSFGRNAWEFVDCFSLAVRTLRKITRQFNVPSGLCVGVLAMLAWLAWCVGWFV